MRRISILALAVTFLWLLEGRTVWAQKYDDKEHAELAKALKDAKVSLEKGLSASESQGKPISGKFELDNGKLQLSVYTMKGDKFSEVIVDHVSGKVAKAEAITEGEDLGEAKAQAAAMKGAKKSLAAVVQEALEANTGYKAIGVEPSLKDRS